MQFASGRENRSEAGCIVLAPPCLTTGHKKERHRSFSVECKDTVHLLCSVLWKACGVADKISHEVRRLRELDRVH